MYGPRLNEYLSSLRAQSVDSGTQSECTIEEAIRSLRNPAKVSCATFETIIAIEKSLDYRHLLLLLSDTRVFPSCVRLLRLYCKEGRRIFDHAYGFLCLQVLGLAVDVGKVAQVNRLGDLRLHILQSPAVSIPLLLSSYSRQIEAREFCQDNEFLLRPATQTLGWYLDASSNHEACLFGIGGCTMQDVEFLLEQLWTDRKAFVQAGKYAATSWGWCGLLYVMHNTLAKMWGTFECRTESTKERTTWLRLCELSHRYSLCTGSTEDETMRYLLKDCPRFADLNYDVTATDAADTNQLIEAYVAKMATHPVVKWSYTSKLLGYICTNVHLDESRYEENLARITSANLEESWFLLAGAHTMDLEQWKVLVDTIMNNSIMTFTTFLELKKNQSSANLLMMTSGDLYELLGRIVLFPLSLAGRHIIENPNRKWHSHPQEVLIMFGLFVRDHLIPQDYKPVETFFSVWNKIYQCLEFHQSMANEPNNRREYADDWKLTWHTLGASLELVKRLGRSQRCEYPRCPIPDTPTILQCSGCGVRRYCSRRCQQGDWVNMRGGPGATCLGSLRLSC